MWSGQRTVQTICHHVLTNSRSILVPTASPCLWPDDKVEGVNSQSEIGCQFPQKYLYSLSIGKESRLEQRHGLQNTTLISYFLKTYL